MSEQTTPKHYVILGGTSGIAIATMRDLAKQGHKLTLFARNSEAMSEIASDLEVRGAGAVHCVQADLASPSDPAGMLSAAQDVNGKIDGVLVFYGILGDQARAETDLAHARQIIDVNYTSVVDWVLASAALLEANESGVLLTVSSVAGDRGRRSNFVYGSAKAGLSVLMQGLAHKWGGQKKPLRAVNMKLGFVDTPMTSDIEKGGPLWAQPEQISQVILKALRKGGPNVYGPWFWRWVMLAIRCTPSLVFNKVNL